MKSKIVPYKSYIRFHLCLFLYTTCNRYILIITGKKFTTNFINNIYTFVHMFTKLISNVTHVSVNKQLVIIPN